MNEYRRNSIFNALSKVSLWTGLSRVFGLVRDIATTSLLGASVFHDIFVVTLKIPNLFRRFFAEGAFNQAFVPIYSDYHKQNNEDESKKYLSAIFGSLLSILFIFTLIVLLITPIFILIFAPGFYYDDYKKEIAIDLLRIMFPYLALISLVAFSSGIQNTHDRFSLPAFTPLIFNVCLIIAAIYIAPKFSIPVYALAWGVLLAGLGASGMLFFITPTFQFILGLFLYNEPFDMSRLIGFILIWVAVIIYLFDLYEKN